MYFYNLNKRHNTPMLIAKRLRWKMRLWTFFMCISVSITWWFLIFFYFLLKDFEMKKKRSEITVGCLCVQTCVKKFNLNLFILVLHTHCTRNISENRFSSHHLDQQNIGPVIRIYKYLQHTHTIENRIFTTFLHILRTIRTQESFKMHIKDQENKNKILLKPNNVFSFV